MTPTLDLALPTGVSVATHVPLLQVPEFWDPRKAYAWYAPDIEGAFIEGCLTRQQLGLRTAAELVADGVSNMVMITDLQADFRDGGRLPVGGTDDVVLRVAARLLNGTFADYYTGVVFSQDGHGPYHLSYSTRWRMQDGSPFDLRANKAAVLELVDRTKAIFRATCFDPADGSPIDMGYIQSMINAQDTVAYWDHLQSTGQGPIWVFATHCKLGTDGVNLHPLIAEVLAFMEGARLMAPVPLNKGHIQGTDWFGPLEPCRPDPDHPQGGFQKGIVDMFADVDGWVEFAGVAQDFCDYWMKKQVMQHFAGTEFFKRMAFLTDGTAPIVPNAAHVAALNAEARTEGVAFLTHDEPFAVRS